MYCSKGLAVWHGFPDILHINDRFEPLRIFFRYYVLEKKIADSKPVWPPRPSFCPNRAHFQLV